MTIKGMRSLLILLLIMLSIYGAIILAIVLPKCVVTNKTLNAVCLVDGERVVYEKCK